MANRTHVARLKQGVEAWNQWRRDNPKIRPTLSRADLIRASLRGADLRRTNLGKADLSHADLRGAQMSGANLHGAALRGAELIRADLRRADLRGADLFGANLRGADVSYANLSRADLDYANLRGTGLSRPAPITRVGRGRDAARGHRETKGGCKRGGEMRMRSTFPRTSGAACQICWAERRRPAWA